MYNSNPPSKPDLPSTAKLIKSTILAAGVAVVLLVGVVMPAEYGIDPTGIGKLTGLKKMGEIKTSLAKDAAAEAEKELANAASPTPILTEKPVQIVEEITPPPAAITTPPVTTPPVTTLNHEKTFTLADNGWTEIKLKMRKGDKADFIWFTDGGRANFDIHADSKTLKIDYHNYAKGSKLRDEGILEAKFDGSHGWFWRNRSGKTMTITLNTSGEYQDIVVYN